MESIAEALVKIAETEEKVYEAGYLNGYVAGENSASIEIDATLTQEGAAADAKAVGDALLELPHTAPNKDYFHITQEMIENPLESHPYPNNGEYYYKLLDIELDPIVDNLVGTTIFSIDEEGNEITEIININNIYDNRPDGDTSVAIYGNEIDLWIVTEDFDMEMYIDEETTETLSVTKGIWMIAQEEELRVKDIEVPCEVVNRLDEKYLPKTIVGKNVEGKTFIIEDEEVVAQEGAEIFNDYLNNKATGRSSHAEGDETTASGHNSHAEGGRTTASGLSSHAEGCSTTASGLYSHAEGYHTEATGLNSHAEGYHTEATGRRSHAEGGYTIANGDYQHVQGKYNIADTTSAFIIGNGDSNTDRSNAMTVDWDGNAKFAGDVTTGSGNSINGLAAMIGDIDTALDNIISIQESYLIPNGDEVSY